MLPVMLVVVTKTVVEAFLSAEPFSVSFRNTMLSQVFTMLRFKYRNLHIKVAIFFIEKITIKYIIIF